MVETTLNSLCVLICGLDVILTVIFILRNDNLVTRAIIGAVGVGVLLFRWSVTLMLWQFIEAVLTLAGLAIGLVLAVLFIGGLLSLMFRW